MCSELIKMLIPKYLKPVLKCVFEKVGKFSQNFLHNIHEQVLHNLAIMCRLSLRM